MQDAQARQVAHLNGLFGDAEGASNQCLRGDYCRGCGQTNQRQQRPVRGHQIKRVFDSGRVFKQQRALAKIVQHQARHDDAKPGKANRFFAKMAEVSVKRLSARDAEHHCSQNNKGHARVGPHKTHCIVRADGFEDFRVVDDLRHTQQRNGQKPDQRDRAKKLADAGRAFFLYRKKGKQNDQGYRYHAFGKGG